MKIEKLKQKLLILPIFLIFFILIISFFKKISASGFSWNQNNWSSGTSTDLAYDPINQENWDKYSSQEDHIIVNLDGHITLDSSTDFHESSSTADFLAGRVTGNAVISESNGGEISPKRPLGYDCNDDLDCKDELVCDNVGGICSESP